MQYRIIVNSDFKNHQVWGSLNHREINGSVVGDDFISSNNIRKLEGIGAVKIIPIGDIPKQNFKKNSTGSARNSRKKQLLEV